MDVEGVGRSIDGLSIKMNFIHISIIGRTPQRQSVSEVLL